MARRSRKAEQLKQELLSTVQQQELITQPVTFAYLNGEMSVMQARIQTVIMEKLQLRIAKFLKEKAKDGFVGSLFSDDDFAPLKGEDGKGSYLTFTVKYSELGVAPANYRYVSDAARAMQGSMVYEKEVDGYRRYIVAFPIIDVPDGTRGERRTDIKLHMTESTAKYLFRITPYHRYLKDAVFLFNSGYTGRIYLLINANKQLGTWTIDFEELRKILLTTYDQEKKSYVCTKYRNIKDFKKRVLEPARKEMEEMAGRIDCTFDYEVVNKTDEQGARHTKVVFHIHLTDLGKNIKQGQLESQEAVVLRNTLMALHLTLTDANRLMKQMPASEYTAVTGKAKELIRYYRDVREGKTSGVSIKDYRAHALTSLQNFIAGQGSVSDGAAKAVEDKLIPEHDKPMSEW